MRFFDLHKEQGDILAMRASLGLQKAGGTPPAPPAPPKSAASRADPPGKNKPKPRPAGPPPVRADLKPGEAA